MLCFDRLTYSTNGEEHKEQGRNELESLGEFGLYSKEEMYHSEVCEDGCLGCVHSVDRICHAVGRHINDGMLSNSRGNAVHTGACWVYQYFIVVHREIFEGNTADITPSEHCRVFHDINSVKW